MVEVSARREKSRIEIAKYLREFADELDPQPGGQTDTTGTTAPGAGQDRTSESESTVSRTERDRSGGPESPTPRTGENRETTDQGSGDKVTVIVGNESATINPPETLMFDVEVDTDVSLLNSGNERRTTFTLSWSEEQVEADDEMRVE